ncbi:MAG: phosphoribosylformylglycinamidine synthase subunit PurL [Chloroflexota bacterium]
MPIYKIEIRFKKGFSDPRGSGLVKDIADLGVSTVAQASVGDVYWLEGDLSPDQLERIGKDLLADPLTQEYRIGNGHRTKGGHSVEVAFNPGVSDPVEGTVMKAVRDLGITGLKSVRTGKRYIIQGRLKAGEIHLITQRLLVNPIVQHVVTGEITGFPEPPRYEFSLRELELLSADEKRLSQIAGEYGFSTPEVKAITGYFRKLGRNPTDAEIETLAQTWSEHCVHKTFRGRITCDKGEIIDNLLRATVMRVTRELDKPWCLSVFEDNSGVIEFDEENALCFKVETHNHPSAVEPYGGAATGIGGVIRDILGTGLAAKPIANTDVFCFAPPDYPYEKLPPGVLHPRRIFKGVRAGVADYGNRLGIPTLNGAILFDEDYLANPLVYCGTVGLLPKEVCRRGEQKPGDLVVLIGGGTGRDGIHGVTFASTELTGESVTASFSAVQIGNPIVEKKLIDVLMKARERRLFRRITDCGGGGLSSAVGEMAETTGVRVYLDRVHLKYAGLSYTEIWISESQERMVLAVPPECVRELLDLCEKRELGASVIGEFTDDRRLKLFYEGRLVGDLPMEFLHGGRPQLENEAVWEASKFAEPDFPQPKDLKEALLRVLSDWNICSKEWVIRQYDHEVQGGSVLKPLQGRQNDGPGDAAIIRPILGSNKGAIIACGINPNYGKIDPYWMAASAIDEALRQVIAVGGSLERIALLDNFCWGRTSRPEMLGALVRAAQACYDMAKVFGTPFISGKDSLNNEFEYEGKVISIPHTLLISALGVMADVKKAISMDFKRTGDLIYLIGTTQKELGGSAYLKTLGFTANSVPRVNPEKAMKLMESLSRATAKGLVRACHDLSDGGLAVALAEMAFAGGLGARVHLKLVTLDEKMTRDDFILFSESNSRFLAEVAPENQTGFENLMAGSAFARIGEVTGVDRVEIFGLKGGLVMSATLPELKEAWQKPLRW